MLDYLDEFFMGCAIYEARSAARVGEVPVGACLVDENNEIISAASNRPISLSDPTAHAEIIVLREAAGRIGNYRLTGFTLYCTIEPCVMCAGALVNARISRLVFGAADPRFGAVESRFRLCDSEGLNHRMEIRSGVRADECRELMQVFFRERR